MSFFSEMRERRLLPFMGAYLVTGFVALEGVDQLVSYEILPVLAYKIALVFYLFGIPGSLTIAWYHGAKGRQDVPKAEILIQASLFVLALLVSVLVFQRERTAEAQVAAAVSSGLDQSRIAVLYFEDLSSDGSLEYVADGLTESLIQQLSEVRSLDVVSRNGVAPFRETSITPDSLARILDVGTLIRGSVESSGDDLRITTRLVDGASGADIERRLIEIPSGQFLAARDSVAEGVGLILRERLGEEVRLRQRMAGTTSDEAWSFVQRAERLLDRAEAQAEAGDTGPALLDVAAADSLLQLAELADPTWVRPTARRAHMSFRRAFFLANGFGDFDAATAEIDAGLELADAALRSEPADADALEQRGSLRYLLYLLDVTPDSDEADRLLLAAQADLEAAVDSDPTRASVYSVLSHLYVNQGDNVSVILTARRAYEEDAYLEDADRILRRLFWAHYNLEQFRDARTWCNEGSVRFPENYHFAECKLWLMIAPAESPDVSAAWGQLEVLDTLAPDEYERRLGRLLVAGVLMRQGLTDSATAVFASGQGNEEIDPLQELVLQEAAIRSVTGDPDRAVELVRIYLAADPNADLNTGGGLHWWWRNVSGRPDFQALLSD